MTTEQINQKLHKASYKADDSNIYSVSNPINIIRLDNEDSESITIHKLYCNQTFKSTIIFRHYHLGGVEIYPEVAGLSWDSALDCIKKIHQQ